MLITDLPLAHDSCDPNDSHDVQVNDSHEAPPTLKVITTALEVKCQGLCLLNEMLDVFESLE